VSLLASRLIMMNHLRNALSPQAVIATEGTANAEGSQADHASNVNLSVTDT
jgi:hypothetical protein